MDRGEGGLGEDLEILQAWLFRGATFLTNQGWQLLKVLCQCHHQTQVQLLLRVICELDVPQDPPAYPGATLAGWLCCVVTHAGRDSPPSHAWRIWSLECGMESTTHCLFVWYSPRMCHYDSGL